ncbi:hypothetical protein [Salinactinospora qingdaonensis]|uniref:Uncharacterized protein n=1 Tax=Salinactinospora qingdaonensis TaxID=702744 RepID=A0ABP7FRH8_9ACTN
MASQPVEELFKLAASHRRALQTVDDLRDSFGFLDFEGPTFPGCHHHATLVSAAYCVSNLSARAAFAA